MRCYMEYDESSNCCADAVFAVGVGTGLRLDRLERAQGYATGEANGEALGAFISRVRVD